MSSATAGSLPRYTPEPPLPDPRDVQIEELRRQIINLETTLQIKEVRYLGICIMFFFCTQFPVLVLKM